jgi:pimeloyl-ACP methyl ester carboxylesterase
MEPPAPADTGQDAARLPGRAYEEREDRQPRAAVREGDPVWPPLLCNGMGASLELLQPFVDALDPRRPVIRFDMPGIGGSPAPVVPYHLHRLPSLLAGLLDELGHDRADVLGISWGGGWRSSLR